MPGLINRESQFGSLAPEKVCACRWSARHQSSLTDAAFAALKHDIAHTGGNQVPVLVRPLPDGEGHELVYGERRLRACTELGLPLQAIVRSMSDKEAARARTAECRYSAWSAFERGTLFGRMLQTGLYPSRHRQAEDLGVALKELADDIRVAELPAAVLAAFEVPTQVKVAWAKKLAAALELDPSRVLAAAKQFTATKSPRTPSEVYAALLAPLPPAR